MTAVGDPVASGNWRPYRDGPSFTGVERRYASNSDQWHNSEGGEHIIRQVDYVSIAHWRRISNEYTLDT